MADGVILNGLQRARRLLPPPVEQHALEVGLVLELVHWFGPLVTAGPEG